jgi:RHS repeat-associated protein
VQYNFNLGADNGNLGGITNNRNTNRSQSYSYDAVNRIAGAATLSTCTATCWHLAFGVDEWANITAVSGTGNATLSPNGNNQIGAALFTYDASGNELTDATSTYAWNAESQMKTGGGVTYVYDGRGNRVEKSGTKLYWYGQNGQVLDETDTTGSTTNAAFSEYIYFAGARIARRDYLNNVYYYFEDQVNSSRTIAEMPAGSTTPTLCYDADFYPYGGEIDFTSTCAQNYKFQGKERDTETNNDYFGARFYSSAYGRFLSPDWSKDPEPIPYADLTNPQSLNLYSFVKNNPLSRPDADGHCDVDGEHHWGWCIWHTLGLYETQVDRVNDARNYFTNNVVTLNGNVVDPSKLNDQQVLQAFADFDAEWRRIAATGANPAAVLGAPFMTSWGWNNSPPYNKARNELAAAGDHPDLNGKVPTREEANRMIQESGGTVDRNDPGHSPGGVSSHTEPHVNYTTASGQKATVTVREQ